MSNNKYKLSLSGVDANTKFNRYTVLLYYADPTSKTQLSLDFHIYYIYRLVDYQYDENRNTQVNNTPAVIY